MGLDGDAVVHGCIRLARTLLEHDVVDELRLMVYPVIPEPANASSAPSPTGDRSPP